jgi:hypothetical protein
VDFILAPQIRTLPSHENHGPLKAKSARREKTACICHMYSVRISAQVDFVMVSLTAAKHNAKS